MTTIESTPIDVNEVLEALETFINKRPGLDFRDYGELAPYRQEIRAIAKDKKRALEALAAVRRSTSQDPALLADSFKRAFSGRLEWIPAPPYDGCPCDGGCCARCRAKAAHLEYTAGQYFPTEYRKAAASVLETYTSLLAQKWAAENPDWRPLKFRTVADVKAANKAIGNHWFDAGTLRFFNTRIESKLLSRGSGRQFFITSERMDETRQLRYSIREALPNGEVDTFGEFQQYSDIEDARHAVKGIA